jgi:hypothetical protein
MREENVNPAAGMAKTLTALALGARISALLVGTTKAAAAANG